jgi:DNA-binding transcriptional LysR family regulator
VELRQLEYLAAVVRHGHVTRAADDLHLTQSALSQQIRRLEQELGLVLLHRTPRGVEATPAGRDLARRAEAILADVAEARVAMDEHAGVVRGVARVAVTAADALRLVSALVAFHGVRPGVRITLRQGSVAEVLALVRGGSVDVGVLAAGDGGVAGAAGIEVTPVGEEPLVVVAGAGDELLADGPVGAERLRGRPLILTERGTALRDTILAACVAEGFSPIPLFEVADPAAVRSLAAAGLGVSVVPASWLDRPGPEVGTAPFAVPAAVHRLVLLAPSAGATAAGRELHEQLRLALGDVG